MSQPEWALIGMREGDTYIVLASQTLTRARLEQRAVYNRRTGAMTTNGSTLTAEMDDITRVEADNYLDALQELFHTWQPVSAAPPIEPGDNTGGGS